LIALCYLFACTFQRDLLLSFTFTMPRPITPPPTPEPAARRRRVVKPSGGTAEPPRLPARRQNPWLRRALLFATLVLVLDALVGEAGLAAAMRARTGHAAAAASLQRIREENAELLEQIRRLQHDPAAIEEVAREELGLVRPGEVLIVVRDAD
jgi:cell division protein FtsB